MAIRNFLFLDPSEGFVREQATSDSLSIGRLVVVGDGSGYGIDVGGFKVQNMADPTAGTDAATKQYVDQLSQGVSWKNIVRAATTADITLSGAQTIDTVSVIAGDRVLVKDQTTASENGIYVAASGAWVRSSDADAGSELVGAAVFVDEGSANIDNAYLQTAVAPISLGTTSITWVLFTSTAQVTASHGLQKIGNDIQVKAGDGIDITSNSAATNVKLDATPGLKFTGSAGSGALAVKADTASGITVASAGVQAKVAGASGGIVFDGSGNISFSPDSAGGVENGASGVLLKLADNSLQTSSSGVSVKDDPNGGLQTLAAGLGVKLADASLALGSSGVSVKEDASGGIYTNGSNGIAIKLADTSLTTGASGASVAYAPKGQLVMVASGAISAFSAVYPSANDKVSQGDASAAAKSRIVGLTTAAAVDGASTNVVHYGKLAGALSGATFDTPYYMGHGGTPVLYSALVSGDRVIRLGYALNATDLYVSIQDMGQRQ